MSFGSSFVRISSSDNIGDTTDGFLSCLKYYTARHGRHKWSSSIDYSSPSSILLDWSTVAVCPTSRKGLSKDRHLRLYPFPSTARNDYGSEHGEKHRTKMKFSSTQINRIEHRRMRATVNPYHCRRLVIRFLYQHVSMIR